MSSSQLTNGHVAWLNLWDYEMSLDELNALTCESEGNLVTQSEMSISGAASFTYDESFACGKYEFSKT